MKNINKLINVLIIVIIFYSCNGEYDKKYYDNGKLSYEGLMLSDTIPEGIHKWYYENGQLRAIEQYSNGVQIDTAKEYYSDGVLARLSYYVSGLKDGNEYTYYKNGNLESIEPFKKGKIEGVTEFYYSNGNLHAKSIYVDNIEKYYEIHDSLSGSTIDVFRDYLLDFPDTISVGEKFVGSVQVFGSLPNLDSNGVIVGFSEELREGVAPSFETIVSSYWGNEIIYLSNIITKSNPIIYYNSKEMRLDQAGKSFYFWGNILYEGAKTKSFTHTFYVKNK